MPVTPLLKATGSVSGGALAITTSDVTVYDPPLQALNVGVTGAVALTFGDGSAATLTLASGMVFHIGGITKVNATGTTATGIVGFRG
jgi:hypothetical protein